MVAVIEDNVYNLEIIKQMLMYIDAEVCYFETGISFLSELDNSNFDMVFLDLELPDTTGFEIVKIIREKEKDLKPKRRTYITALTAHSADECEAQCLKEGFDSYLKKPFKMQELHDIINKHHLSLFQSPSKLNYTEENEEVENLSKINSNELRKILLEVFDSDFLQMKDAFLKKDKKTIKYFAHKLKGSFSLAGENELAGIFKEIEFNTDEFKVKTIKKIENKMDLIRAEIYKHN